MSSTSFRRLEIRQWQQFEEVDLTFGQQMTVLTGANGSGKTTILNLLAKHVGWDVPALGVPRKNDSGIFTWLVRLFRDTDRSSEPSIGSLHYSDGTSAKLLAKQSQGPMMPTAGAGPVYAIALEPQKSVSCFYIPSHRPVFRYAPLSSISVSRITRKMAFERVASAYRSRYFGGGDHPVNFHIKEVLVSWSIFGRGNSDMDADPELSTWFSGFEDVLKRVLPPSLGFNRFRIRNNEIVLSCTSGDFLIDAASGGISTLIDLAWQLYMYSEAQDESVTVLIDEVENHLHPSLQRRVLPDLVAAFPTTQFVVATHSPLVVGSVKGAKVYALAYSDGRVVSRHLDFAEQASSALRVLNEVLDVPDTMPLWAEQEITELVERFTSTKATSAGLAELRKELEKRGLGGRMPDAISKIAERSK